MLKYLIVIHKMNQILKLRNSLCHMPMNLFREPTVGLIMWLRPKGLKVYSYVEKYAEFKN